MVSAYTCLQPLVGVVFSFLLLGRRREAASSLLLRLLLLLLPLLLPLLLLRLLLRLHLLLLRLLLRLRLPLRLVPRLQMLLLSVQLGELLSSLLPGRSRGSPGLAGPGRGTHHRRPALYQPRGTGGRAEHRRDPLRWVGAEVLHAAGGT